MTILLIVLLASALVGIGVGIWLLVRSERKTNQPDIFFDGIHWHLSPKTQKKINIDILEEWMDELDRKWLSSLLYKQGQYLDFLSNTIVHLDDTAYYVKADGQKMAGYTYILERLCYISTISEIGLVNMNRIKGLIQHELSHIIYAGLTGSYNEKESHDYLKQIGV